MKRVLVVSHPFPPAGGGGVQRTVKLVKYLPGFGWEPEVLTVRQPAGLVTDATLLADIPREVRVHRTWTPEAKAGLLQRLPRLVHAALHYAVLIPDPSLLWVPVALNRALQLQRARSFDAIYVTGNPFSSYLIGIMFKRLTGRPFVADIRDYWSINPYITQRRHAVWRNWVESRLEHWTLKVADAVLVVSETMADDYRAAYPKYAAKIHVVYNGADTDDFPSPAEPTKTARLLPEGSMHIVHAGTFTGNRRPEPVLKALDLFRRRFPDRPVHLWLVGAEDVPARRYVEQMGLQDRVTFVGYVDHATAITYMQEADLLLLVVGTDSRSRGFLTGKLFEYLKVGRPILAIVPPDSDPLRIIERHRAGRTVTTENPEAICNLLAELFIQHTRGELHLSRPIGDLYTRRTATKAAAQILSRLVGDDIA